MKWFPIKNKNYYSGTREYPISEVARLTGITVRSLRNYLKSYEELLSPKRGYYNSLIFNESDLHTFVMIKTLIKDGLKQAEIIERIKQEKVNAGKVQDENSIRITLKNADEKAAAAKESEIKTEKAVCKNPPIRKEDLALRLIDAGFIDNAAQTILELDRRNAQLEAELNRLKRLLPPPRKKILPDFNKCFSLLVESTQCLWHSLCCK
jgi:DNA-binding transcriptional MerR regulator